MTEKGTLKKFFKCLERIERGRSFQKLRPVMVAGRELSDVCAVKGNI